MWKKNSTHGRYDDGKGLRDFNVFYGAVNRGGEDTNNDKFLVRQCRYGYRTEHLLVPRRIPTAIM